MHLITNPFRLIDNQGNCFRIRCPENLNSEVSKTVRSEISHGISNDYKIIYLDVTKVTRVDLSGINEIFHTHYILSQKSIKFMLIYQKDSVLESWIRTTGLDRFVDTALVLGNQ